MSFHVKRLITNADWKTGTPAVFEDITAEYADKRDRDLQIVTKWGGRMTRETARNLANADRRPAQSKTGAGKEYDAIRAIKYCEAVSGHKAADTKRAVMFKETPLPGEKVPRAWAVRLANGDIWPIPHWDWQPAAPVEESI
jgi:hypothetical protein